MIHHCDFKSIVNSAAQSVVQSTFKHAGSALCSASLMLAIATVAPTAEAQVTSDPTAPVQEVAPSVSLQDWNSLIAYNLKQGPPIERTRGFYITMTQMTPNDPTKTHHSEYFSTVGNYDGTDFTPMEVLQVSETWTLNKKGNWEIDQWFFDVDMNGNLISENHIQLVETPDRIILDDKIMKNGGVKDPAVLKHWAGILTNWLKVTAPATPQP